MGKWSKWGNRSSRAVLNQLEPATASRREGLQKSRQDQVESRQADASSQTTTPTKGAAMPRREPQRKRHAFPSIVFRFSEICCWMCAARSPKHSSSSRPLAISVSQFSGANPGNQKLTGWIAIMQSTAADKNRMADAAPPSISGNFDCRGVP